VSNEKVDGPKPLTEAQAHDLREAFKALEIEMARVEAKRARENERAEKAEQEAFAETGERIALQGRVQDAERGEALAKGRADKLAAENVALTRALEEIRGLSSTCGYDSGGSRIHKLALDALAGSPETAKIDAVLICAEQSASLCEELGQSLPSAGVLSLLADTVRVLKGEPT
jgi:hypothetical protein